MSCPRALNENLYPKEILNDKIQFYTDADLCHYFNLKGKTWKTGSLPACCVRLASPVKNQTKSISGFTY